MLNLSLNTPRIAVSFTHLASLNQWKSPLLLGMDIAEIRYDLFSDEDKKKLEHSPIFDGDIETLFTIRHQQEGGQWSGEETKRLNVLKRFMPKVNAIDLEISCPDLWPEVVAEAKTQSVTVVASFHDFEKTPSYEELTQVIKQGQDLGADVVKIAAMVHSTDDLRMLARVLVQPVAFPLVVIGMGERGAVSRCFFPFLGSIFTFASWEGSTAPGQLPLERMKAELTDFS